MDKLFKFMGPSNTSSKSSTLENGMSLESTCSSNTASKESSAVTSPTSPEKKSTSASSSRLDDPEVRLEEKLRQKAFAHFDVQSMTASIHGASNLQASLAKRRNTTTGASAASMVSRNPSIEGADEGDGRSNHIILSCPYFRNELGGEEERMVCLSRVTADSSSSSIQSKRRMSQDSVKGSSSEESKFLHRPNMASGLALLEDANEKRWRLKSCPYQRLSTNEKSFIIENFDIGATYYREHFYGLEHQNWFGVDDALGPIAISVRKERIPHHQSNCNSLVTSPSSEVATPIGSGPSSEENKLTKYQYRLIVRTSEISVLRGCVFEACIPGLSSSSSRHNHHMNHHGKEVFEYLFPEVSLSCLRLGVANSDEQLLKLDEQVLTTTYKVGVIYCRDGQSTEEEMYNNEHSSPAFDEFLSLLGDRVRLKGFPKYRAGLDNKTDTTGTHAIYANYNDCEVMFHVSTLLPFTPNNKQQLLRKRHIGNDIVTIIFQEPGATPFTAKNIRSHFQHVFIVVRLLPPTSSPGSSPQLARYSVSVSRSKEVPIFGPPIPEGGIFSKNKAFAEFLLAKVINGENAAHKSDKFRSMAQRTRHEYLKDLASNYVTNTTVNDVSIGTSAGAKLVSSFFGGSKKRSLKSCHFIGDAVIKGAIMWDNLSVEDFGQSKHVDCILGISSDTLLLMEEPNKELMFVVPNVSILGWSSHPSYIKIYYHQGECILIKCKDPDLDEIAEIVLRLRAISPGVETQEMILRRNAAGQLGFHVNHEGIVTEVEQSAFAWQVGLRPNFRIVEICKVAIATLNLDQVQDLLKTSVTVTVTVVPPNSDGSPRRGCNLTNCSYLTALTNGGQFGGFEYENISGLMERTTLLSDRRKSKVSPSGSRFPSGSSSTSSAPPSTTHHPHAAHHQPFLGSRSTPVSPEQQQPFSIAVRSGTGMSSMRVKPTTTSNTLKASPTSAFSTLSPAISLSEFSQHSASSDARYGFTPTATRRDYYYHTAGQKVNQHQQTTPGLYSHPQLSRHHFIAGGPLVKTRSEISLTNPSPTPPTSGYHGPGQQYFPNHVYNQQQQYHHHQAGMVSVSSSAASAAAAASSRRYPSPSRSHSTHFPIKPPSISLQQQVHLQNQSHQPPSIKQLPVPPTKPGNNGNSGYYSDTSSSDAWSLPFVNGILNNNTIKGGSGNSSLDRRDSSYQHQTNASYRTPSTPSRSAQERLRMRSGSLKSGSIGVNGTSLQEDLLKLITPDPTDSVSTVNGHLPNESNSGTESITQYSTPYSSLERPKINGFDTSPSDVVIEAQPAHVVTHHPAPVSKPPRSNTIPAMNASADMTWPSLVDAATKAIASNSRSLESPDVDLEEDFEDKVSKSKNQVSRRVEESLAWLNEFASGVGSKTSPSSSPSKNSSCSIDVNGPTSSVSASSLPPEELRRIEETVEKLQTELVREKSTNATLEEEVNKLKEENQRLQEESQTAAAQLRKFTEWFFQNINAK